MPSTSSTAPNKTSKPSGSRKPASPKQLAALRRLAAQTGTTFATPTYSWQASRELDRMIKLANSTDHRLERDNARRERRGVSRDHHERTHDGVAIHDDEIRGWGSSAAWA